MLKNLYYPLSYFKGIIVSSISLLYKYNEIETVHDDELIPVNIEICLPKIPLENRIFDLHTILQGRFVNREFILLSNDN